MQPKKYRKAPEIRELPPSPTKNQKRWYRRGEIEKRRGMMDQLDVKVGLSSLKRGDLDDDTEIYYIDLVRKKGTLQDILSALSYSEVNPIRKVFLSDSFTSRISSFDERVNTPIADRKRLMANAIKLLEEGKIPEMNTQLALVRVLYEAHGRVIPHSDLGGLIQRVLQSDKVEEIPKRFLRIYTNGCAKCQNE